MIEHDYRLDTHLSLCPESLFVVERLQRCPPMLGWCC